jgi:hypothetical protein
VQFSVQFIQYCINLSILNKIIYIFTWIIYSENIKLYHNLHKDYFLIPKNKFAWNWKYTWIKIVKSVVFILLVITLKFTYILKYTKWSTKRKDTVNEISEKVQRNLIICHSSILTFSLKRWNHLFTRE